MLPDVIFPEFVPDQVLTSDDLNRLFGYLDVEGRMTRSNLLGIGIVCGFRIRTASDRSSITITKGVGVTTEGYLIRIEEDTVFTAYKPYDSLQEETYDKFVNDTGRTKQPRFDLLELKEDIEEEPDSSALLDLAATLDQYVVLLFVELLAEQNKNCDPSSCDDKGIKVTVTIRPLLVSKFEKNFSILLGNTGNPLLFNQFFSLDEIKISRYDVSNSYPVQSQELLQKYIDLLSDSFLTNVETKLTQAYTIFSAVLGDVVGTSPFAGLKTKFDFIRGITTKDQLIHLQYYYDIISDFLQGYNELRALGNTILSLCCPDRTLFPRHLLLGEAVPVVNPVSSYRHYFIYSPLFEKKNLVLELRSLFTRLVTMMNNISIPPFAAGAEAAGIKITPSKLGDESLSQKSIPYYYKYDPLFKNWNFDKWLRGIPKQNLSYNAPGDAGEQTTSPLRFEMEPFNFLRIEGHIGQRYTDVVQNINLQKAAFRLPINVIALSTGEPDLSKLPESTVSCNIRDIQTSYELVRREWEAVIGKMIEYLNPILDRVRSVVADIPMNPDTANNYVILLVKAKTYMVTDLKIFISKYSEFLPVYESIEAQSQTFRTGLLHLLDDDIPDSDRIFIEDLIDHFDEVVLSVKKGGFRAIYQQFNSRINEIYSNMFFAPFVEKNPGIQHKAGVPIGGTFIVVYHRKPDTALKGPFTINGVLRLVTGAPASFGFVQVNDEHTNTTVVVQNNGTFSIVVNALPVVLKGITFVNFFQIETGEVLVTAQGQTPTIVVPSPPVIIDTGNNVYNSLRNDDVIADFYLPYLCSCNCTGIQFIINETKNQAPVADAGTDQEIVLPTNTTMLDGSKSSDPEKHLLTFKWVLVSGQADVAFSDDTSSKPAVSFPSTPDDYVFELTVTDDEGAQSHSDQVIVKVKEAPNKPPTALAGDDQTIRQPVNTTMLRGTAIDPENRPLTMQWSMVSGPAAPSFDKPTEVETAVSSLNALGTYVFRLTVTDDKGMVASDDVAVNMLAKPNDAPVANAGGPITLTLPTSFAILDGTGSSDPEGNPLGYLWQNTGLPLVLLNKTSPTPVVYDMDNANTYKLSLTVTDDGGLTASDDLLITVKRELPNDVCFPLGTTDKNFDDFRGRTTAAFQNAFPALDEVRQYFKAEVAQNIAGATTNIQSTFFSQFQVDVRNQGVVTKLSILPALEVWLPELFEVIMGNEQVRSQAMELYDILVELAIYIACFQKQLMDTNLKVATVFRIIQGELTNMTKPFVKNLTNDQLLLLLRLRAMCKYEVELIKLRGEDKPNIKLAFMNQLQDIIALIDSLLT